jgi:tRNA-2-methylthio-N6-dimethylallyladenosine synthase
MKQEVATKKVFIRTLGCQMNVRDSEVIAGLLMTDEYRLTTNPNEADVIIFNTCSVRQHAEDKVWSEVGRYNKFMVHSSEFIDKKRKLRTKNNELRTKPIIGLIGCMAKQHKERIFQRCPNVDFVVGPSDIYKIPDIIKRLTTNDQRLTAKNLFEYKIWETDGDIRPEEIYHTGFYQDKEHAYVVISEGCSNFCSYCVVPYVRGRLRNRKYEDILKEIEEAIDMGITKITLLGQNVNAYVSGPEVDFVKLLGMVNRMRGLKEFSFITSHPKDTSIDLFKAMAELEKLKKYLHLPVQSGSDRILKLMNRGYTKKEYLDLVDTYRRTVKDAVLTTDIIVGFPTETQDDFLQTYNLIKDVEFEAAFIFKYSTRPNTEAAKMNDDIEKKEKERRHRLILDLQRAISKKNADLNPKKVIPQESAPD